MADLDLSWKQTNDAIYLLRNNRWYRDDFLEVPAPLLERWLDQYAREWMKDAQERAKARQNQSSLPAEVKAAKIRRLLDWQAEVVSTLTPWQIFGGLKYATAPPGKQSEYVVAPFRSPFERQVYHLVFEYRQALFYASLSAAQRTALLAGNLEFNTLGADQQQQVIYLQPLLQICVSPHAQPLLGMRSRDRFAEFEANMHIVIIVPSMQQTSLMPSLLGQ